MSYFIIVGFPNFLGSSIIIRSKTWFIRSAKVSMRNAFVYFSILKLAFAMLKYQHCLSKNCNTKVSIANFSAPNKLSYYSLTNILDEKFTNQIVLK